MIAVGLEWFYLCELISKYIESILEGMKITHKEYKHTGGKRQEYFAVYREYAGRHKIELILAIFDGDTKNKSAC